MNITAPKFNAGLANTRRLDANAKNDFLASLRGARLEYDALLAQIDRTRVEEPLLHDGWSLKDLVGHIAYYERWLLDWLEAAVRGKVTVASHRDVLDVDARNALIRVENRERAFDDLVRDSQRVFARIEQLVAALPEGELTDPHRFERYIAPFWNKPHPLMQCIANETSEHYAEHRATLLKWLARQAATVKATQ
jgi:hypothetical protein